MLFDGFTVIAEIINFVILVFLLQRFLYKPVMRAMDAREQKIASALQEARDKRQQAEQEAQNHRQARRQLEEQREALLSEARSQAETYHQELVERSRAEINEMEARWRADVEREKLIFLQELRLRVAHEVIAVSRRALEDLAGADLEQQATAVFIERIQSLDGEELAVISEAVGATGETIEVRSTYEIPPELRQRIIEALRERIGEEVGIRFETAPDLVFGIELTANGHKLSWNLKTYLDRLEESISAALVAQTQGMAEPSLRQEGEGR